MAVTILDPTNEAVPVERQITPRPEEVKEAFEQRLPQVEITRYTKPTFSKPAPDALRAEINSANDFVVEALAD